MSLANETTRFLAVSATGPDGPADGPTLGPLVSDPTVGSTGQAGPVGAGGESAPRDAPDAIIGSRVGAYLITKRIGEGGVGEVFKGVDVMLQREVAIKMLRDELTSDPVFLKRFSNEAKFLAKLSHSNVASVHAFLEEGGKQFMVMEYVPGISLDEFIRSGGPVPIERALSIFRKALDGIGHAHGHGIVHRDIKPANIMLADSGQVKVMDFGIARALDSQEQLTRHGQVAGTAKAMAPEQIRGAQADVRSDIYSLGIVLYALLAGRPPFQGQGDHALMLAQLEQAPPPLRSWVDNVPPKLEAAVMRALEKDPTARFQSVAAFAQAIDACMAELHAVPLPPGGALDAPTSSRTVINPVLQGAPWLPSSSAQAPATPASGGPQRKWPWLPAGAAALGVVALGLGVLLWPSEPTPAPSAPEVSNPNAPPGPASDAPVVTTPVADAATQAGQALDTARQPTAPPADPAAALPPAPPSATALTSAPPSATAIAPPATVAAPVPSVAAAPPRTLAIVRLAPNGADVPAGAIGPNGSHRFKPGERIQLRIAPSQDSHVYCYLQDETRRIVRFHPNRFNTSAQVLASAPLVIPGAMGFELFANNRQVPEAIACFAAERDVAARLPASVLGSDLAKLPVASLDEVRQAFVRVAGEGLFEARFQIVFK